MDILVSFEDGSSAYLKHHGIKGQRWGVTNGPPYPLGKGAYSNSEKTKILKERKTNPKGRYNNPHFTKVLGLDSHAPRSEKKSKKQTANHNSNYDKIYNEYVAAGYSKKNAAELAAGRERTKKVLLAIGAVAVASAAIYVGYRMYDKYADRVIPAKQLIQTVHFGNVEDRIASGNPFYATFNPADNFIYGSKAFTHFRPDSKISKVFAHQDLKIAGEASSMRTFRGLLKENPMIKYVDDHGMPASISYKNYLEKVLKTKIPDNMNAREFQKLHNSMSFDLVHRGSLPDAAHKVYYDALKKRGFHGVIDMNDAKLSGGGWTYDPVIMFAHPKLSVASSKTASKWDASIPKMIAGGGLSYARQMLRKPYAHVGSVAAGTAAVGIAATKAMGIRTEAKQVHAKALANFKKAYLKQHPGSTLTDSELEKMYEESMQK